VKSTDVEDKTSTGWECKRNKPVTDVCAWSGVTCDESTGLITVLDLRTLSIVGKIPASLGGLNSLTYLHLGGNSLAGSIPNTLAQLTAIRRLRLYSNSLTGYIPSNLGSLPALYDLELDINSLEGSVPAALCNSPLTELAILWPTDANANPGITCYASCLSTVTSLYVTDLSRTLPVCTPSPTSAPKASKGKPKPKA